MGKEGNESKCQEKSGRRSRGGMPYLAILWIFDRKRQRKPFSRKAVRCETKEDNVSRGFAGACAYVTEIAIGRQGSTLCVCVRASPLAKIDRANRLTSEKTRSSVVADEKH